MAESSYNGGDEGKGYGQSFNEKLGEIKKFASTSFTRARQYTIEKIGKAESVTTFDTEYETLSAQLETIRVSTEKIVGHVQALVQPNPGVRLEENIYTRLERAKPHRSETEELLGAELGKASTAFGNEEFGSYLRQCGAAEVKMGQALVLYHSKVQKEYLTPLKAFLEVDIKNVMKERKTLAVKRLDLDAAKSRARKLSGDKLMQAEIDLRESQADFDMQLNKVREGTRKVIKTHVHYMGYLKSFMAAQKEYHRECLDQLDSIDTEGEIAPLRPPRPPPFSAVGGGERGEETSEDAKDAFVVNGIELDREKTRRARVLYDYEAVNEKEITVYCDQKVSVTPLPDDDDYVMAELDGGKRGMIPSTYVEMLS